MFKFPKATSEVLWLKIQKKTVIIRKILVAVDTSTQSNAALEAAAAFAKVMKANIHGLYVQEEHWEQIGRLPSATMINELTGETRLLEEGTLDKQVQVLAKRLQRKLKTISRKQELSHTWRSVKGRVIEEILKAGKEVDLITIGRRSHSVLQRKRLGSTAKAIIDRSEKPVLVLTDGLSLNRSVTVVYDASEESKKGLQLALSIAKKNRSNLFILVLNNRGDEEKEVEQMVDKARIPVHVLPLNNATLGNFIHLVKSQRPGLLVIPKKQPLLKDESLEIALEYFKCPVLLMS